jgi:hypothetical protein
MGLGLKDQEKGKQFEIFQYFGYFFKGFPITQVSQFLKESHKILEIFSKCQKSITSFRQINNKSALKFQFWVFLIFKETILVLQICKIMNPEGHALAPKAKKSKFFSIKESFWKVEIQKLNFVLVSRVIFVAFRALDIISYNVNSADKIQLIKN